MPELGDNSKDWAEFWAGEDVIFIDPVGQLYEGLGEPQRVFDISGKLVGTWFDPTYYRRTGRKE